MRRKNAKEAAFVGEQPAVMLQLLNKKTERLILLFGLLT
jgi:hypothetical protein